MTSCKIRLSLQRPTKILFDFRMSSYVAHQLHRSKRPPKINLRSALLIQNSIVIQGMRQGS